MATNRLKRTDNKTLTKNKIDDMQRQPKMKLELPMLSEVYRKNKTMPKLRPIRTKIEPKPAMLNEGTTVAKRKPAQMAATSTTKRVWGGSIATRAAKEINAKSKIETITKTTVLAGQRKLTKATGLMESKQKPIVGLVKSVRPILETEDAHDVRKHIMTANIAKQKRLPKPMTPGLKIQEIAQPQIIDDIVAPLSKLNPLLPVPENSRKVVKTVVREKEQTNKDNAIAAEKAVSRKRRNDEEHHEKMIKQNCNYFDRYLKAAIDLSKPDGIQLLEEHFFPSSNDFGFGDIKKRKEVITKKDIKTVSSVTKAMGMVDEVKLLQTQDLKLAKKREERKKLFVPSSPKRRISIQTSGKKSTSETIITEPSVAKATKKGPARNPPMK